MVPPIILLIPIFGLALGGFAVWLKHKEKMANLMAGNRDSSELFDEVVIDLDRLKEENAGMRERLQNLEAIVTDESFDQSIEKRIEPSLELPPIDGGPESVPVRKENSKIR